MLPEPEILEVVIKSAVKTLAPLKTKELVKFTPLACAIKLLGPIIVIGPVPTLFAAEKYIAVLLAFNVNPPLKVFAPVKVSGFAPVATTAPIAPLDVVPASTIFPAKVELPVIVRVSVLDEAPRDIVPLPMSPPDPTVILLPLVANVAPLGMVKEEGVRVKVVPDAFARETVPEVYVFRLTVKAPVNVKGPVREDPPNVVVVVPALCTLNVQGFVIVIRELVEFAKVPPFAIIAGVALPRLPTLLIAKVPEYRVRPPVNVLAVLPLKVTILLLPPVDPA